MIKIKPAAAALLCLAALVLYGPAVNAQTSYAYSDSNYNGRYSCDLTSAGANACSSVETNTVVPELCRSLGVTATYVVQPNGAGMYTAGEMYLNNPRDEAVCVFTLRTYGIYGSSYWVDPIFGVANETLSWEDYSDDNCGGQYFTDYVQGSLVATANSSQPASQALITDDNLNNDYTFPGSGNCMLGGSVNAFPED
jgi:hypothetical protein